MRKKSSSKSSLSSATFRRRLSRILMSRGQSASKRCSETAKEIVQRTERCFRFKRSRTGIDMSKRRGSEPRSARTSGRKLKSP